MIWTTNNGESEKKLNFDAANIHNELPSSSVILFIIQKNIVFV